MRDIGNYVPYSFRTVCGFFYVPQELIMKSFETGPTVLIVLIREDKKV